MLSYRSPQNLQRVGFLACIPRLLQRFGVDPLEVLTTIGLDAQALDDVDSTIPYQAAGLLMQVSAEKTRCPHFGLELGKQIRPTTLGLVGELMRNAPSIRAALQDFSTHQHRNAHGAAVYLLEEPDQAFFGYAVYQPNVPGSPVICDAAALGLFTVLCELAGAERPPALEVLLSRVEPDDLTPYRQAFGVKLCFNAEQTALALPRRLLDQPVRGANSALRADLEARVRVLWHAGDLDTVTHLRRELRLALLTGGVSAPIIAARLDMSPRTLNRRLDAWGVGFQDMLDEARCEFAQQLLANTQLSIGYIATIVGYTDPAVLTRSFTRWAGVNPSEWKRSYKADAGGLLTTPCASTD